MFVSLKRILVLIALLISASSSFSEVKEIKSLEDYSNEILEVKQVKKEIEKKEPKEIKNIDEEIIQEKKAQVKKDNLEKSEPMKKVEEKKVVEKKVEEKKEVKPKEVEKKVKKIDKEKKELALEEPENKDKDNKKYEMITYHSADGVEWTLPDNFKSVVIGDLHGNIIFSKDGDKTLPLASVTKMMTLMVTFDEIEAGNISLKDKVRIGKTAVRQGGSGIKLKEGEIFTLEDLIKASAIYSANNATYAIAEYVGDGSIYKFVKKMNAKLKELGLSKEISYYTPAGLPTRMTKQPMDEGTAKGIYKLSLEALKYKKYLEIAGIEKTKIHNGKISIRNRNHLLGEMGIYGIKTGYHKEAKYNIAVASKYNGADVVIVVMGGESYKARDGVVLNVLENFHENYTMRNGIAKKK